MDWDHELMGQRGTGYELEEMSCSYQSSWSFSIRKFPFSVLPFLTPLVNLDIHNSCYYDSLRSRFGFPLDLDLDLLIEWVEVVKTTPQLAEAWSLEKQCTHSQENSHGLSPAQMSMRQLKL